MTPGDFIFDAIPELYFCRTVSLKPFIRINGKCPGIFSLVLFFFAAEPVSGQLSMDTVWESLQQHPKFFFQLDAANSFVSGRGANAIGFKAGLDFGKKIRFGAGYYTVVSDIVEPKYIEKYDSTYNAKLQMDYYTTFVDYVLYDRGKWQFTLNNQFGIGNSYFWYYPNKESKTKTERINQQVIVLYEPALMGHYKILKWVGIGFGTGYRIMLMNNKEIDHRISSPIYSIRLKIFMNEIVNSIWPNGLFRKKPKTTEDVKPS